jgi:hypothetical protein
VYPSCGKSAELQPVAETANRVKRSARRSDAPFYVKRQGGVPARSIFLWWFLFFYAAENTEKWGKLCKNCSGEACWTLGQMRKTGRANRWIEPGGRERSLNF